VKISLTELLWYNHAVLAFSKTTTPGRRGVRLNPTNPPPCSGSAAEDSSLLKWPNGPVCAYLEKDDNFMNVTLTK